MPYRYSCVLLFTASCLAASAQPGVLNSSEMLPPGSIVTYRLASNPGIMDTTSTGSGVSWDFTALQATGNPFTLEVLAPAAAPHTAQVPGANYAIYENAIPRYSYFNLNTQEFARVGYYVNTLHTYTDPQVELVFPVALGSSHSDTWANTDVSFPGTYDHACIATGSLALPGATYPDVLLVRIAVENIFPLVAFQWFDATNGSILAMYFAPSFFQPEGAHFASNVSIGIEELGDQLGLRLNTLVDQHLHVTYTSPQVLEWRVMDVAGRLLREGILPAHGVAGTAILDMGGLAQGIHLLELRQPGDGNRHVARFMKH
jgi:hypothetical protein